MIKNVLIVAGDLLPISGWPSSGAGLRAWGLGQGLETHGFEVSYAIPGAAAAQYDAPNTNHKFILWDEYSLEAKIRAAKPEAVIFCHWPTVRIRHRLDVPTVIDFHGPHMLERAFQNMGSNSSNALLKIEALRKADFFTCAGHKQKMYFLAWLMMSGVDVTEECIKVIPVSMSPEMPSPASKNEPTFVYGGVYLPWQDPVAALTTVVKVLDERHTGLLQLFGGRHPHLPIAIPLPFQQLERQLHENAHVRFEGFQPHDIVVNAYLHAHVAVDLMTHNYERELAFTTRTVEYMWCGLPVIYNNFSELSPLIQEYDAGWTLDPKDLAGLERIVNNIIDEPGLAREKGLNAQRLVRERMSWDITIEPLVEFLQSPVVRPIRRNDLPTYIARQFGVVDYYSVRGSVRKKSVGDLVASAYDYYRHDGLMGVVDQCCLYLKRLLSMRNN